MLAIAMRCLATAAAVSVAIGVAQPGGGARAVEACTPASEAAIATLSRQWSAALAVGAPDEIAALYAEDAVLVPVLWQRRYVGREEITGYFAQLAAKHPQATVTQRSIVIGCDSATDTGAYVFRVTGERKGTRMLVGGRYRADYERRGGRWLIVHHHISGMYRPLSSTDELRADRALGGRVEVRSEASSPDAASPTSVRP